MGDYEEHNNEHVLKLIKTITEKPIKYVINLHSHPDHNGGNKYFTQRGATLITHENAIYSEFYDGKYPDNNMIRFDNKIKLDMGNETIVIQHMIAHTFDDGIVYLKNSNLIFIGESYKPNYITYLGKLGKTSFDEWGNKALAKMSENTVVVPAHGNASLNKSQLLAYRRNVLNWYERISYLFH
jgi:glyoxylase-like metal-dependent hydrolase (beta-lactamase superfamily II)